MPIALRRIENRRGPANDPWGTPDITGQGPKRFWLFDFLLEFSSNLVDFSFYQFGWKNEKFPSGISLEKVTFSSDIPHGNFSFFQRSAKKRCPAKGFSYRTDSKSTNCRNFLENLCTQVFCVSEFRKYSHLRRRPAWIICLLWRLLIRSYAYWWIVVNDLIDHLGH